MSNRTLVVADLGRLRGRGAPWECLVRFVGLLSGRHVYEMNFSSGSFSPVAATAAFEPIRT
jgi:hypothetical protein